MDFSQYSNEYLEEWDWKRGVPTGRSISRKDSYEKGIPHEGVHLWIGRLKNFRCEILFQKRADHKILFPGCLDITVGGHVPFGMTENKVQKEAFEELGISPKVEELFDLGYMRFQEKTEQYWHREFQHVYTMRSDMELDRYRFLDGEVQAIFAVSLENLRTLLSEDHCFISEGYDGTSLVSKRLGKNDFHPLLFSEKMKIYMDRVINSIEELLNEGNVRSFFPPIEIIA